jgi:uncharacterized membrane protein
MESELYVALDARLRRLERNFVSLRADLDAAAPAPAALEPFGPAKTAFSFEAFFAGRGLQLVGLLLVLLGVAFFLNLAFTRGWIGPAERIIMGLIGGTALLAFGARRLRATGTPVAEGLLALGGGILYLSLWAAVVVFPQLGVPRPAAFAAMVAVTGILALLAAVRRSERVALMGIAAGFLTPILLNGYQPAPAFLAGYIVILGGAFAWLGVRTRSRFVDGTAFVASALYLPSFLPEPTIGWPTAAACATVTAIFALYAIAFSAGAMRDRTATTRHLVFLTLDALAYATMLAMIFHDRQTTLGIALLALSAAALLAARLVPAPRALIAAYTAVGLSATTLALPALLHREALIDAFAIEGALLVVLGARSHGRSVAFAGVALLGVVALCLIAEALVSPPAGTVMSSLTLAFAIGIVSFVVAGSELIGSLRDDPSIASWSAVATLTANTLAVVAISRVLLDALGGSAWNVAVPSHVQVALSLVWASYATVLFALGLSRCNALAQRQGLVLLGITIVKVFVVDLGNVDLSWRIVSFVALGTLCIAISAWYMRSRPSAQQETVS